MTLHSEIHEQPGRLAGLLEQRAQVERIAAAIQRQAPCFVFLAARGTSDNAGRYANYLWGAANRLPLALATPSLFTFYGQPPALKHALVVAVSQSGKSPDIIRVIQEGRSQGCLTLTITNAPASPLAQASDLVLNIQAGEERSVAATKSYTAQLLAIAMLSAALAGSEAAWQELAGVSTWAKEMLAQDEAIARMAQRYRYMNQCVVLGRGYNYATAYEWALKLKELTYLIADPYSSADFQHGPIAMVEGGFPVLAVAPQGKVFSSMLEMIAALRNEHAAELVVVSDDDRALGLAQSPICLPSGIPEWLTPIIAIIAGQLFAYHLTMVKGYDPERPRGLRKETETQ
ncbi:MAG TPA: SIS domain-containing protein [Anaerolineales bacterium]|nr:SIS domain-containing protein [Anaerolineales bacterium]